MKKLDVTVLMDAACIPEGDTGFTSDTHADTTEYHVVTALRELNHGVEVLGVSDKVEPLVRHLTEHRPDIVFNLTEQFRDDRRMDRNIVGLLELMAIPYTGTGSLGLMICRNKGLCKQLLHARRVRVPGFVVVPKGKRIRVPRTIKWPLVCKPNMEDGSDGISNASLVKNEDELHERARLVHERFNQAAIAEQYVEGRELYVGVLGNKRLKVLPPREIYLPPADQGGPVLATARVKFDEEYQKKWNITFGISQLDDETLENVVRTCKRAYRVLQIQDYGRMDLRITPEKHVVVLEANPNPDIAFGEEVAESAARIGIPYNALIEGILRSALRRYRDAN
jgi:D-alanine-D-alanine ligase